MGESLVEAPAIEKKMGEPDAGLGVSVSFGRFLVDDTLSWGKWSHFSQNKYLEEAGNLSTPGLVAQKKAYFEAHYKKVAAQRAMELEQEKLVEDADRSLEEPNIEGILETSSGIDDKSVSCNGEESEEEIGSETCGAFSTNVVIGDDEKAMELEQEKVVEDAGRSSEEPNIEGILETSSGIDDKSINGEKSEEEIGSETWGAFSTNVVIGDEKAMELEQEKVVEDAGRSSEEPIEEEVLGNSSGIDDKSVILICNGEKLEEDIGRETCGTFSTFSTNVMIDDDSGWIRGVKQGVCAYCSVDETDLGEENKDSVPQINEEVLYGNGVVFESNSGEEGALVAAETPRNNLPVILETPPENKDSREQQTVLEKESSKSNARDIARKATTAKRTTDKIASPVVRTPQASIPRYSSRPISVESTKSVPQVAKKKANGSSLPKIKNFPVEESKSVILGDQDIIKGAFGTYQNRFKGSPSGGKCSSLKQATSETCEPKISSFPTPRNENQGLQKSSVPDRKKVSPFLRSDERAEKRKEFLKNLKAKSISRERENAQLSAQSKEEKESEIKKLRQSLNFKATPMPSFYRTRGKGHSQKDGVLDSKIRHHPPCVN